MALKISKRDHSELAVTVKRREVNRPLRLGIALRRLPELAVSVFDFLPAHLSSESDVPARSAFADCPNCHSRDPSRSEPITVCNDGEWTSDAI